MTKTTAVRFAWQTLNLGDILAANGPAGDPPDVRVVEGIGDAGTLPDPLHVHPTERGPVLADADGWALYAAAVAAGLKAVPVTYRPVIRLDRLTPHPDNARENLHIDRDFVESFRADGCRVAVLIQRLEDGTLQVNDGNRRYHGAEAAGLTHLPYGWDERGAAEQHLDMVTTAKHAHGLSTVEEAAALFSAAEAGAGIRRVAQVAGTTQKEAKRVVRVGGSAAVRKTAHAPGWTLEDYAQLQELETASPEAAARVTAAVVDPDTAPRSRWVMRQEITALHERQAAAEHRAELESAGARIVPHGELSDRARHLTALGPEARADHETQCQGHVWTLTPRASRYTPYCANVVLYGHTTAEQLSDRATATAATDIRAVKTGNSDWDTAGEMRREWLAQLIQRRDHKRPELDAMLRTVTLAMCTSALLAEQMHKSAATDHLPALLGTSAEKGEQTAATAPSRRLPVLQFARWAAAHESRMRRNAWRTDSQKCEDNRREAIRYLTTLRDEFGYEPTPIEVAVLADQPYDPHATAPESDATGPDLTTQCEEPEPETGGAEPDEE